MSQSATVAPPKPGKIDRILSAVHLGKKKPMEIGSPTQNSGTNVPTGQTAETLRFKTDDLVPKLNAKTKTIKLTGSLYLELRVELTGEFAKANSTNDLFKTDAYKVAGNWFAKDINDLIANMEKVIEAVDKKGSAKEIAAFQAVFEKACQAESSRLSTNFEAKMQQYLDSNKAIKTAYKTYKIKAVSSIVQNVGVVIASAVVTGLTWGATGPVAVVAIVRSCAGIGVQIYELAIGTSQVIKDIESTLNDLGKLMIQIDKETKNPKSAIAANSTFEMALGVAGGILNIPLPSVDTLAHRIELLGTNLQRMHIERQSLGKDMASLTQEIKNYKAQILEFQKAATLDAKKIKTHEGYVSEFEADHALIARQAEDAFKNISAVITRKKEFDEQLKIYKASQLSWTRQTKTVFGFATSVGLGVGSAGSGLEMGLAALTEVLSLAKEKVFERI